MGVCRCTSLRRGVSSVEYELFEDNGRQRHALRTVEAVNEYRQRGQGVVLVVHSPRLPMR